MNREELESTIKRLEEELSTLRNELNNKPLFEFWIPEDGEPYFFADYINNNILLSSWADDTVDSERYNAGAIYKNREQAVYEANCMKYKHLYRRYIQEHTAPLDWQDDTQIKYYACWDFFYDCFKADYCSQYKDAGIDYASSEQIIHDAIEFVGLNNFKKYVLEIEA